jgi:hypothetical protein
LDDRGRALLHAQCPHRDDGHCPIEAAEAVTYGAVEIAAVSVTLALLWISVPVVGLAFPWWRVDTIGEQHAPTWPLFLSCAIGMTVLYGAAVPRMRRDRREAIEIAASGPTCDPWSVSRTWSHKRERPRMPRPHWRPFAVGLAAATCVGVWLASGSVAGALLATGWATIVGVWADRSLQRRRDAAMARHGWPSGRRI